MLSNTERQALRRAFDLWPQRLNGYGHPGKEPGFTNGLEAQGATVLQQIREGIYDLAFLRRFLVDIVKWKVPGASSEFVDQNEDGRIQEVFQKLSEVHSSRDRISSCTELSGFGRNTGQTRMASAILRFLWPGDYGVVDWRNYAVLSNCEHRFFNDAMLQPLAENRAELRTAIYDGDVYITYLEVLRKVGLEIGLSRVADADLAIYSLSIETWPFAKNPRSPKTTGSDWWIFEAHWNEWERLGQLPIEEQPEEKLQFLWRLWEIIPSDLMYRDSRTDQWLPYPIVYKRTLAETEERIRDLSHYAAVEHLDSLMWNMKLRGERLGVL